MSEFAEWDSFYVIVGSAAGALIGLQFVVMTLVAEPELDSFYVIVGSAAGALIGLQFVVMTLVAERPVPGAAAAGAAFATPTIVHFGTALLLSAVLRAPWHAVTLVA